MEENKNTLQEEAATDTNEDNTNCEISEEAENDNKKSSEQAKSSKRHSAECDGLRSRISELEDKLKASESEAADKYARLAAEYENFRKRSQKERESVYADAVADTVMGIVPIIDNLMYADRFESNENPEKFAEGVRMILKSLPEVLEKMNVSVFGCAGEQFDPNLHNAVMHVEDESYGEGEITDVLQCGYKLGDKVIRYAMVKVAN